MVARHRVIWVFDNFADAFVAFQLFYRHPTEMYRRRNRYCSHADTHKSSPSSHITNIPRRSPMATNPLIILLLGDLVDLIDKLSHSQLQISQLVLGGDLFVVLSMFASLYLEMDSLQRNRSVKSDPIDRQTKPTNLAPPNQTDEFEWMQIANSPDVCVVCTNRPSEEYV